MDQIVESTVKLSQCLHWFPLPILQLITKYQFDEVYNVEKVLSPPPKRIRDYRYRKNAHIKPPKNAYVFFTLEERDKILTENRYISVNELMEKIGTRWVKLNEQDLQKYTRLADEDRVRYDKECEQYDEDHP